MSESLAKIRKKIDAIDDQILECILARACLLDDVLAAKKEGTSAGELPVFDPNREAMIIRRLQKSNDSALSETAIAEIFSSIIRVCRDYQIEKDQGLNQFVISVQGERGSYSEQACRQYCKQKHIAQVDIRYDRSSERVLSALVERRVDYGLVALNNSQGGLVQETVTALLNNPYRIIGSVALLVNHSLLMRLGESEGAIKQIYSHPQALAQCREYLADHYPQAELKPWADTAFAAENCREGQLPPGSAVIAHERCAEGDPSLQIIDRSIQDMGAENETLFLLITHRR